MSFWRVRCERGSVVLARVVVWHTDAFGLLARDV
jgi:hypothetical protein